MIIRDPVDRAISQYYFFEHPTLSDTDRQSALLSINEDALLSSETVFRHSLANELRLVGYASFPAKMQQTIQELDIMILDRFDESLVLRSFYWGWQLEELLYIKLNTCNSTRWDGHFAFCRPASTISPELRRQIELLSLPDLFLYHEAVKIHKAAIKAIPPDVWSSTLNTFRDMLQRLEAVCSAYPENHTPNDLFRLHALFQGRGSPTIEKIADSPETYCPLFRMDDMSIEAAARLIYSEVPSSLSRSRASSSHSVILVSPALSLFIVLVSLIIFQTSISFPFNCVP